MRPSGIEGERAGTWETEVREYGAGNGARTRDIKLGKLALYQLSYARPVEKIIEESARQVNTYK